MPESVSRVCKKVTTLDRAQVWITLIQDGLDEAAGESPLNRETIAVSFEHCAQGRLEAGDRGSAATLEYLRALDLFETARICAWQWPPQITRDDLEEAWGTARRALDMSAGANDTVSRHSKTLMDQIDHYERSIR